jgi:hypothetical protein
MMYEQKAGKHPNNEKKLDLINKEISFGVDQIKRLPFKPKNHGRLWLPRTRGTPN